MSEDKLNNNENSYQQVDNTQQEFLGELSSFFDLLARFDYEDKLKEKSVLKTGPLVSAPKRPVLGTDI